MKNLTKLLGIIVLVAVIGFAMAACEQPTSTTGKTLTGITLDTASVKKAYTQNETLNLSGLVVTAAYSDSTSAAVTGYTASPANGATLSTTGIITVTVSYTEGSITKTDTFTVTVNAPSGDTALSGTISISPDTGVTINMELTATYSGSETVSYQWYKDGTAVTGATSGTFTPTEAGSYTVTVSATGYQSKTSAVVDVTDPSLSTLTGTITISPNTGVTTGTELTATYSGSETVNYRWEKNGGTVGTNSNKFTPIEAGSYTVTVSAAGYNPKTSAAVTVNALSITYTVAQVDGEDGETDTTAINFTFSATVTGLTADDITITGGTGAVTKGALSGSGTSWTLAITVTTAGNLTITIAKSGIDAGPKDVTVYKEGQTAPTLNSISAVYTQGATIVYPTTPLNDLKAGLTVTAAYSNSTTQTVTAYALSGPLTEGTSTVTVTFEGKTTTFTVTVTAAPVNKTLTGITLNTASVKKAYNQNETLNLSGLIVTANYSDSTSATVSYTSTSPANGATLSTLGAITVTVSYTEGAVTRSDTFIVTVTVTDPNSGTSGLAYQLIDNGTAYRVRRGTVTGGAVVIPATHDGLPVTEIGSADGAFRGTNITAVHIPASVTSIGSVNDSLGNGTFQECTSLTSVTFASGSLLRTIGNQAFSQCTSLTNITLPTNVTSIGSQAFSSCTSLASINIPASVTSIDGIAFGACTSLTSVTFASGSSLQTIGSLAFAYCSSLTSITIPANVTSIGPIAFVGCTSLTGITVDANNPNYTGEGGILYNKAKTEIIAYPMASGSVTISNTVTSIGDYAFGATSLTSVTIPASVTSIGTQAFYYCTSLTGITVDVANTIYASQDGIVYNKTKTTIVAVPTGISGSVTIPEGVTSISDRAFAECTSLTSITIPASVTSIGDYAFYVEYDYDNNNRQSYLTTVIFAAGSQLQTIGDSAFERTRLTSITIPAGVTSIGEYAFSQCYNLTSVTFEGTISSSGFNSYAFEYMGDLRAKFYQDNSANGTPGTYTRSNNYPYEWTKQP